MSNSLHIHSITQLHQIIGAEPPRHPLISTLEMTKLGVPKEMTNIEVSSDLYMIMMKEGACDMRYGRNKYDFQEGFLSFVGPNQIFATSETAENVIHEGWAIAFHPDLLINTNLGRSIHSYNFFSYSVYEALHLSDKEKHILYDTVDKINFELDQNIDGHSKNLLVSHLELLLNYSKRFYERQFHTRNILNIEAVDRIEQELHRYYQENEQLESGMLTVKMLADRVGYSSNYLGDLLKKETGKNAKQHLDDYVVELAKNLLASSDKNVSEIAYELGFNYPHYFSRLFKSQTGTSPQEYRSAQLN